MPGVKVIILLRDRVERALSHYWHEVRGGREHLPAGAALEAEPERLRGREVALRAGAPHCRHRDHQVFSYADRSRYSRQVAPYLEVFPAEQVLVLKSELLFGDDATVKQRIGEFLGLPQLVGPFAAARTTLARELADDGVALRALLGETFTWPVDEPADAANVTAAVPASVAADGGTDQQGRCLSRAGASVSP